MKIAFVTPELNALVRRTSLAEVAEFLPRTLRQEGSDVRVFLPFTRDLNTEPLQDLEQVGDIRVKDGASKITLSVYTGHLGDLPIVLIDHPTLFRSRAPYGDEEGPYADNWRRYAVFSRGVLESLPLLNFTPDVIHCMDWTTGLIPVIRELEYAAKDPDHPASHAGTFFAIHNLAMQGPFEREVLPHIGIPHRVFKNVHGVELQGKVNYLKAGVEFATIIGVHSPSFAERVQTTKRGDGLEESFRRRAKELVGITNGIDYKAWDPSNDPLLPHTYSLKDKDLNGKRKCKDALQKTLKLDTGARTAVAAVIGRFDADSGFDILAEVLTRILERSVEVVLIGSGKSEILERVRTMETTFAGRCRLIEQYNVGAAHALLGGADFLILPSHFHSSNSLCAIGMRYGVVPIIYSGSGLEDTVIDVESDVRHGTGFTFKNYSGDSLLDGLDAARKHYKEAAEWRTLAMRCMKQDFSWAATAQSYLKAYRRVTRRTKSSAVDE
ncbi:MAG: glycogen synthase [Planctomycetes bacterium]|nr:glycogen synthase [Planctomycetota bacterium]